MPSPGRIAPPEPKGSGGHYFPRVMSPGPERYPRGAFFIPLEDGTVSSLARLGEGVLGLLSRAGSAKALTSARPVLGATVTRSDATRRHRGINPEWAEKMARATGYVAICEQANAQNLAACPIRMFRPAPSSALGRHISKSRFEIARDDDCRPVKGARRAWLKSDRRGLGPGAKAAQYARDADDIEEIDRHPVLDLIADPNPEEIGTAYWELHHSQAQLAGNAFHAVVVDGQGRPVELRNLQPQWVNVRPDDSGERLIAGYEYGRHGETIAQFEPGEVLHFQWMRSRHSPYWGQGWLDAVLPEHDLRTSMNTYQTSLIDKQATPPLHIQVPEGATENDVKALRAKLQETYGGAWNAGKWFITTGISVTPLAFTPKDMEYIQGGLAACNRAAIFAACNCACIASSLAACLLCAPCNDESAAATSPLEPPPPTFSSPTSAPALPKAAGL